MCKYLAERYSELEAQHKLSNIPSPRVPKRIVIDYDLKIVDNITYYKNNMTPVTGIAKSHYESNGGTYRVITLKDGKEDGAFKQYYYGGSLWKEGTFKDGKEDGVWRWYWDNRILLLQREITYKNGKADGVDHWWYESGRYWAKKTFKDGKLHGDWKMWHDIGQSKEEGAYIKEVRTFKEGEVIHKE